METENRDIDTENNSSLENESKSDTKVTNKVTKKQLLEFFKNTKNMFDIINKKTSKALRKYYAKDIENIKSNENFRYLYPSLVDPNFNFKIFERKEFNDLKFDSFGKNVEEEAEKL